MRGRRPIVVGIATAVLAGLAAAGVVAAFTATTGNTANSLSAAASFADGALLLATGSYTGDGTDNRAITTPGFRPDLVIVKADATQIGVARTSTMTGDASKPMTGAGALAANLVQSLDAAGFTVGTNNRVNRSGTTYNWLAVRASVGTLAVGSYAGTGAARSIAGAGFSPEYVMVFAAAGSQAVQRAAGMTSTFDFANSTGNANSITSLDADGFSLGTAAEVNTSGAVYHYVAWNEAPGTLAVGSYAGTGAAQDVDSPGFQPAYVVVRGNDTATGRRAHQRFGSIAGTASARFDAGANNASTAITSLEGDGFDLGTAADVNAAGTTFHYLAARSSSPSTGCSSPGTLTVTADADTWVDQSSPGSSFGSGNDLELQSRSGSRNRRVLLRFPLPALPAGCTVVSARLRLFAKSGSSGRAISAFRAASAWAEGTATWSNQPATAGVASSSSSSSSSNVLAEWSVAAQVQALYAGSNTGFVLRDAVEDSASARAQRYQAREDTPNDPELILTFG